MYVMTDAEEVCKLYYLTLFKPYNGKYAMHVSVGTFNYTQTKVHFEKSELHWILQISSKNQSSLE